VKKRATNAEIQLKEITTNYLKLRNKLNVRGALEYCRSYIANNNTSKITFDEPIDNTLKKRLENNEGFREILKEKSEKLSLRLDDVIRCLNGLYHTASKDVHGHAGPDVAIMESVWVPNERVTLASIFAYCKVKYSFVTLEGITADPCPF